jgi:hypothetical protein
MEQLVESLWKGQGQPQQVNGGTADADSNSEIAWRKGLSQEDQKNLELGIAAIIHGACVSTLQRSYDTW